jgi:hypothetical protein
MMALNGPERRMETLTKLYALINKARHDNSLWPLMAFLLAIILFASYLPASSDTEAASPSASDSLLKVGVG